MTHLDLLKSEAVKRNLLPTDGAIDPATAFALVRDMPYLRASDRRPETVIREWRGTCSGKHYLLKALFAELGLPADLMACTIIAHPDPATTHPALMAILEPVGGRFVDVHNYLVVHAPAGDMIVDATWPLETERYGMVVNRQFRLGENQQIAYTPSETWVVPEDVDPQAFKDALLAEHFTPAELAARDQFIRVLSEGLVATAGNESVMSKRSETSPP
ncbi:MAG TPA: hypothetical protein G4N94_02135 [Caldilineae bacterium]|nr:hypothetical protein [Caldilineae bacterium]